MQSRCKLAEMVIRFLVEVKTSFFHRFSIIYPTKKSQLQWIVPGIGPGAAITITGDATPDQVAAGVAVEAEAAAAGGPEALPAVEEIHRSSLEKGQGCQVHQVDEIFGFLHRSSVQLDGCWMILIDIGIWWVLAAPSPTGKCNIIPTVLGPPKIDGSNIKLGFQEGVQYGGREYRV